MRTVVVAAALLCAPTAVHAAGPVDWLFAPISGSSEHEIAASTAWHGRIMVLAWAVLMPTALVVARYFKITPRQRWPERLDNPFWFISHRRIGYILTALMTIGLIAMLWGSGWQFAPFRSIHAFLGWAVVILAWLQIVGANLRGTHGGPMNPFTRQPKPKEEWPGDHFSMTRRRRVFEWTHKSLGYLLVALAVAVIQLGLVDADAPVWMFIAIAIWWLVCVVAVVELQRRVRCIDTYQAIWGLDRTLPGYRHPPIGVGIARFTEADASNAPWQNGQPK